MLGEDSLPLRAGKVPLRPPITREIGDQQCKMCPKWDADRERPRADLSGYGASIVGLAKLCHAHECLPDAGGMLDQDPILMDLLHVVYASPWWRTAVTPR